MIEVIKRSTRGKPMTEVIKRSTRS